MNNKLYNKTYQYSPLVNQYRKYLVQTQQGGMYKFFKECIGPFCNASEEISDASEHISESDIVVPRSPQPPETTYWQLLQEEEPHCVQKIEKKPIESGDLSCLRYIDNERYVNLGNIQLDETSSTILDQFSEPILFTSSTRKDNQQTWNTLRPGIYNYILLWDEKINNYQLAISYFLNPEYGTKHNMLFSRILHKYKDIASTQFILSGELLIENENVFFSDESSFYWFERNCIKSKVLEHYNRFSPSMLYPNSYYLDLIDRHFPLQARYSEIDSFRENPTQRNSRLKEIVHDLIKSQYTDKLEILMKDVFLNLFTIQPNITYQEVSGKNKRYTDFYSKACSLKPQLSFPIYKTEDDCYANTNIDSFTCD